MPSYQLISCTASKPTIRYDESVTFTVQIKNVSGRTQSDVSVALTRTAAEVAPYVIRQLCLSWVTDDYIMSWGNNVTKSFTFTACPTGTNASESLEWRQSTQNVITNLATNRAFQMHLYIGEVGPGYEDTFDLPCYYCGTYATPSIDTVSMMRALSDGTENDEGEKAKTNLTLSMASQTFINNFALNVYYKQNGTPTTTDYTGLITYDSTTSPSISTIVSDGITDSVTFITRTGDFGKEYNWGFLFVFGDQYESTTVSYSIPRAFANVHLSGCATGGVAFGKFSTSTLNKPLFECEYPIKGVNLYELTETSSGSKYFTSDIDTGGRMYIGNDVYAIRKFTLLDMNTSTGSGLHTVNTVTSPMTSTDILISISGGIRISDGAYMPWGFSYDGSANSYGVFIGSNNIITYRVYRGTTYAFTVFEYAHKL